MRIAAIADTHGNLIALEAVLRDLRSMAPDLIVNLGDLVSGPFDPSGAADAQRGLGVPTLAGNHERQILEGSTGRSDTVARDNLSAGQRDWIASLPKTWASADGGVFACHGSPAGGDLEYLLEDISFGRPMLDTEAAIRPRLAGIGPASLVLCGHTHTPRVAYIDGMTVVNPGSVGFPAYTDEEPVPHIVELGSPHARYAIITQTPSGWDVDLRAVVYDWDAAGRQALAHGRPDAARWITTGRV